ACAQPAGYVADSADCADGAAAVNPGANEVCGDAVDNDCDTLIDDPTSVDALTWYLDGDGDTYGDAANSTLSCTLPAGYVADDEDCDDGAAAVNPAALERCSDAIDNNCDGLINDPSSVDALVFYLDRDGDGFGGTTPVTACTAPSGAVSSSSDCDDSNVQVYPGQTEFCNGYDDDCDGSTSDERNLASLTYDGVTYTDRTTASQNGTTLVVSGGQTATLNLCEGAGWMPYASVTGGTLDIVGIAAAAGRRVDVRSSASFGPELFQVTGGGTLRVSGLRVSLQSGGVSSGMADCRSSTLDLTDLELDGVQQARWVYADACTTTLNDVDMRQSIARDPSTGNNLDGGAVY
ncbi:MAG: putative metal-binding motif-containing protein, partial [bacterium]